MKIWVYWEQGWDNAPFVVQECRKSLESNASEFEVIYLDAQSVHKYIDIPEIILKTEDFPIQLKADYIRCVLLSRFGGIWIDSTVYLNSNLNNFISNLKYQDFFCFFRNPLSAMSNWFLLSKKNSLIITKLLSGLSEAINNDEFIHNNKQYFKSWRNSPNYFLMHSIFHALIKNDASFREEAKK